MQTSLLLYHTNKSVFSLWKPSFANCSFSKFFKGSVAVTISDGSLEERSVNLQNSFLVDCDLSGKNILQKILSQMCLGR